MRCVGCGSAAVSERAERTVQGYRRFRCRDCGKQFNERTGTILNRTQYPSDVIALVVLWRLRYKLALRDLPEMFAQRGMVFSHEAVRDWEAKLTPALADDLRRRRRGKAGCSWYVDETYLKVEGRWCYFVWGCQAWDDDAGVVRNSADLDPALAEVGLQLLARLRLEPDRRPRRRTSSRRTGATARSTVRRLTLTPFSCTSSWRTTSALPA
jgi:hypothetical protein